MTFEEWWEKQTASFDPEEIGLMQLAKITWESATLAERERIAEKVDEWTGLDLLAAEIRRGV